jgi:arylsulfatase A
MNRRNLVLFYLLTFLLATNVALSQAPKTPPNIIFILADDLGYGDLGVNGQRHIQTPNIDRLAKEGMRFTRFYSGSTVCAPSRAVLMSGYHTGHVFIRGNKGVSPEGQYPIADSIPTVAEQLKKAGYATGAFGKWGLGAVGSEGDPLKQGFDRFYGYNCQSLAHRYYPNHLWDNDRKVVLTENQNLNRTVTYAPDLIHTEALNFVDTHAGKKPFFLFVPTVLPHAELLVPDDEIFQLYKGKFEETPHQGNDYGPNARPGGYTSQEYPRATFAAMVGRLDKHVGEIVAKLKEKGIENNTLIVFSSDNGPHKEGGADPVFFNSNGSVTGTKRDLYEGGIRVPFIANWPGIVKAGTVSTHIGAFWDILPTFSELAGVASPNQIDGISFVNTLNGKGKQKKHEYLYWEFHEQGGKQAVRKGNWKAVLLDVKKYPNGPIELFNLKDDPTESVNLADKHPKVVAELRQIIKEAHRPSEIFPLFE